MTRGSIKLTLKEKLILYWKLRRSRCVALLSASVVIVSSLIAVVAVIICGALDQYNTNQLESSESQHSKDQIIGSIRSRLKVERQKLKDILSLPKDICNDQLESVRRLILEEECEHGPTLYESLVSLYDCCGPEGLQDDFRDLTQQIKPLAKVLHELTVKRLYMLNEEKLENSDLESKRSSLAATLTLQSDLEVLIHSCDLQRKLGAAKSTVVDDKSELYKEIQEMTKKCSSISFVEFLKKAVISSGSSTTTTTNENPLSPFSFKDILVPIAELLVNTYKSGLKGLRLLLKYAKGSSTGNSTENREFKMRGKLLVATKTLALLKLQDLLSDHVSRLSSLGNAAVTMTPLKEFSTKPTYAHMIELFEKDDTISTGDKPTPHLRPEHRANIRKLYFEFSQQRYLLLHHRYEWAWLAYQRAHNNNTGKEAEKLFQEGDGRRLWKASRRFYYYDLLKAKEAAASSSTV